MIVVTNNSDSGAGSLRQAIADAALGEEITFSITGTIELSSGELLISQDVIITGPGSGSLTISGLSLSRVFNFDAGTNSLSGVKLKDGVSAASGGALLNTCASLALDDVVVQDSFADVDGGGIWNGTIMNATDISITACGSNGGNGGGLYNEGTFNVTNLTVDTCTATGSGGGIFNISTVTSTSVLITSCQASGGDGGAIYNNGTFDCTALSITSCTSANSGGGVFSDGTFRVITGEIEDCVNNGSEAGGAIHSEGTTKFTNFKISNNSSSAFGDGIFNAFGTVTLIRCEVSANNVVGIYNDAGTVIIDNSTISSQSIGIINALGSFEIDHSTITKNDTGFTQDVGSTLTIRNTILAGNDSVDYGCDETGFAASNGHNIFGNNTVLIPPNTGDQSVLSFDALFLGELQNNGGITQTHAILDGSPALDAGDSNDAPATDQRGFSRIINGSIDIGAYEAQGGISPNPPGPDPGPGPGPHPNPNPSPVGPCAGISDCQEPPPNCGFLGHQSEDGFPGIANLSAEAPDVPISPLSAYSNPQIKPPLTGGGGPRHPIINDSGYTGPQLCVDLVNANGLGIALGGQTLGNCNPISDTGGGNPFPVDNPDWGVPPNNPFDNPTPRTLYPNVEKVCSVLCPDGQTFTYTVGPGSFFAPTQAEADSKAVTEACKKAQLLQICVSGTFPSSCLNDSYIGSIVVTGAPRVIAFTISDGILPPGLTLTQSSAMTATVSGNPNVAGVYNFTVTATDTTNPGSITMSKQFTVQVINITTDLPDPVINVFYTQQLAVAGCSGTPVFSLLSGSLPTGLALSSSGLISGTVTSSQVGSFSVAVTCGGKTCSKFYQLAIDAEVPFCANPDNLVCVTSAFQLNGDFGATPPEGTIGNGDPPGHCSAFLVRNVPSFHGGGNASIQLQVPCFDMDPAPGWFMHVVIFGSCSDTIGKHLTIEVDRGDHPDGPIVVQQDPPAANFNFEFDIPMVYPTFFSSYLARVEFAIDSNPPGQTSMSADLTVTFHQ